MRARLTVLPLKKRNQPIVWHFSIPWGLMAVR